MRWIVCQLAAYPYPSSLFDEALEAVLKDHRQSTPLVCVISENRSIVLWYRLYPIVSDGPYYAASVDGSARLIRASPSAEPPCAQGIANEKVHPGPSFGDTQRRPW
jgi:hypothetical protein